MIVLAFRKPEKLKESIVIGQNVGIVKKFIFIFFWTMSSVIKNFKDHRTQTKFEFEQNWSNRFEDIFIIRFKIVSEDEFIKKTNVNSGKIVQIKRKRFR